jgi:hypothetical protein
MNTSKTPLRLHEPIDSRSIHEQLAAVRVRGFTPSEREAAEKAIREDDGEDGERWDTCF